MASASSIPSITTTITDPDDYDSAQEEPEPDHSTQNGAEAKNENEAEEDDDDEADITELTVFIPKVPLPTLPQVTLRPQSAFMKHVKSRRREQLMEQEKNQVFKILCGIAILLVMFGLGALMVVLALMFDIEDLFILGGIFLFGGVIFTFGFIIVRCTVVLPYGKADMESPQDDYVGLHSPEQKQPPSPTFQL